MAKRAALLGIGRLLSLEVLNPSTGRVRVRRCAGKWLGWDTGKRCFAICTVKKGRAQASLPKSVRSAHQRFHQSASRGAMMVDAPSPVGSLKQVGLVKALTYDVPRPIRSPEKNKFRWHHAFGDTGHTGSSNYPTKVMPALMSDHRGNLFIKRRPGNIFTVDSWLRG